MSIKKTILDVLGYSFRYICNINPDKDKNGRVEEFLPQNRYFNKRDLRIHRYGAGPFCQFRISGNLLYAGVYFITLNEKIVYVGECQNLLERFNVRGYGTISPRNCFKGGQPTNCKINNLVLQSGKEDRNIELWFYPTDERKEIEAKLILRLQPPWNSQLKW